MGFQTSLPHALQPSASVDGAGGLRYNSPSETHRKSAIKARLKDDRPGPVDAVLAENSRPPEEQRVSTNSPLWVVDSDRLIIEQTRIFGPDDNSRCPADWDAVTWTNLKTTLDGSVAN